MTPILSTYAWPVFDVDGRVVAVIAVEEKARAWAATQPKHTVGEFCSITLKRLPESERRALVQSEGSLYGKGRYVPAGTIPWSVHLAAWNGYAAAGHGSQSAERINERGGFGYREVQCCLAGHYNRCGSCGEEHPPVPGWEPRPKP